MIFMDSCILVPYEYEFLSAECLINELFCHNWHSPWNAPVSECAEKAANSDHVKHRLPQSQSKPAGHSRRHRKL